MDGKQGNSNNNNNNEEEGGGGGGGGSKQQMNNGGGYLCRQSSSRWTPTSEQIRILKELYYNNGVRSPSADQIQRISARLRQYGKIEGKNVFYWFQNHKARERQKKRFTSSTTSTSTSTSNSTTSDHHLLLHHHHHQFPIPISVPKQQHQQQQQQPSSLLVSSTTNNKYSSPNISPAPPSSSVMVAVGHMGNYGYGPSATFENSFRECSISGGSSSMVGSRSHHIGSWIGVDPYSSPAAAAATNVFEKTKYVEEYSMDLDDEEQEIETLPLFPIHGGDRNLGSFCSMKPEYSDAYYTTTWYGRSEDGGATGSRTSLELSLNSYATISPDDAI